MRFGSNNNYIESDIREDLINSDLLKNLKEKFGDKLLPIELDLTSMDGFKDYGVIAGDYLSIMNIDILRDFGEELPLTEKWYWLATPNQTPKRKDSSGVQVVSGDGAVGYGVCGFHGWVRPFFITKS